MFLYSVAATVWGCFFSTLAIAAVAFRLRARAVQKTKLGSDDWLMLVALHLYFAVIVAHMSYGFVKLAVLQLYKRIFVVPKFYLVANITVALVLMFMVAATITHVFSAWPITNWWTLGKPLSINYGAFITSFAAIDLALDIAILCLPLPIIRNLHISRRKKLLVAGIFWMGFFCVVATAVRLYFAYRLSKSGSDRPVLDEEFFYVSANNVIWGEIESCCSVIAGCLPTYGPLVTLPIFVKSSLQSLQRLMKRGKAGQSSDESQGSARNTLPEDHRKHSTVPEPEAVENNLGENDGIRVDLNVATEVSGGNTMV